MNILSGLPMLLISKISTETSIYSSVQTLALTLSRMSVSSPFRTVGSFFRNNSAKSPCIMYSNIIYGVSTVPGKQKNTVRRFIHTMGSLEYTLLSPV